MATLKGKYTNIQAATTETGTPIGYIEASATSAKGKIAEIIISNPSNSTDITYSLTLTRDNDSVVLTPTTTLVKNDVHVKSMSTFIQGGDSLNIITSGPAKTSVSIIEL